MRLPVTVHDGRGVRPDADVLLDAAPETVLRDVLAPLLAAQGETIHPAFVTRLPVWVDGVRADPGRTLRENRVQAASVVSLHRPGDSPAPGPAGATEPRAGAELRVVAGPGAGRVHRLAPGRTTVGCGAPGFSLADVQMPADGLSVLLRPSGEVEVEVPDDLTATLVGSPPDAAGTRTDDGLLPWPPGSYLRVGNSVLQVTDPGRPGTDADTARSEDGQGVDFNRPPRLLPPEREPTVYFPTEPKEPSRRAIPWLVVLAPMAMAVPLAVLLSPRFLIFALMSPLMMLANVVSARRTGRREYRAKLEEYRRDLAAAEQHRDEELRAETDRRRDTAPDPATVLLTALGPGRRLWERRRSDTDYLRLRLGLADRPAALSVRRDRSVGAGPGTAGAGAEEHTVRDVPVTVDLAGLGVVGLAGDPQAVAAVASWMVTQGAVLHSPRDLRVVLLTDSDPRAADRWAWVRWLPHARTPEEAVPALVGNDQESVGRRLAELGALVAERQTQRGGAGGRWRSPAPDLLVVLDGARRLRALPGVVPLLRDGPAVGVHVLCLEFEARALPEECRAVVSCTPSALHLHETLADEVDGITPDAVEPAWAQRVARALAPIRDVSPQEEDAGLPPSARLLDCLDLDPPRAPGVLARWSARAGTEVVLGVGYDGSFRLDLRRDGPHALVAGTTGSGKSEFLQTLVASLAVANPPEALAFVLVDYKGGSAFADCAALPHTVGMVTDLDAHLVSRALTSLGAELKRREHLLAGAGAKDLEDYEALARTGAGPARIPRLVIVIDEFASLAAELPDFVHGLIGIAQRGRSLGIHLVLATQRPSGVVSADIRANTGLRVCLRVTDDAESRDVIDAPDAARIPRGVPGRAYVRTGHSSLMPFQSGRVGGRRPRPGTDPVVEPRVWPLPWGRVGLPAPRPARPRTEETTEGATDLSDLVAAVREAAGMAGTGRQPSPWLPPLPAEVGVADLPGDGPRAGPGPGPGPEPAAGPGSGAAGGPGSGAAGGPGSEPAGVAWALEDHPGEQARRSRWFRPGRSGHLYVVGGPGSGRSTALRTLAAGLADRFPARDLHLYGLDCGNGALLPLEVLPHCGVVVPRSAVERADRLLRRLSEEVLARQERLAEGGFADVTEQRAAATDDDRLPYLVLLLDRWEGFVAALGELDGGRLTEAVQLLLREGASVGLHVIVSGDRSLLSGRMSTLVEQKLLLRLPDRHDYLLAGLPRGAVPESVPPGRGLWADRAVEAQVALLAGDGSGAAQTGAVRALAARVAERDTATPASLRPFRLGVLPTRLPAAEVLPEVAARPPLWVPLGVGGDDLDLLGLDLSAAPVAVVTGPPRSGRSTVLRFALAAAHGRGGPALAVCPAGGEVAVAVADAGGWACTGTEGVAEELTARLRSLPPESLVLVDDAELLREGPLAPVLLALVRQARQRRWGVLVAGQSAQLASGLSGWLVEARRGRQGLLLSPQALTDGETVGVRLARSQLVTRIVPGRGLLAGADEGPVPVQVPQP